MFKRIAGGKNYFDKNDFEKEFETMKFSGKQGSKEERKQESKKARKQERKKERKEDVPGSPW